MQLVINHINYGIRQESNMKFRIITIFPYKYILWNRCVNDPELQKWDATLKSLFPSFTSSLTIANANFLPQLIFLPFPPPPPPQPPAPPPHQSQNQFPLAQILKQADGDDYHWKKKSNEELAAHTNYSARILCQLSQCFTTAMVGPRTWMSGIISLTGLKRTVADKFMVYTLNPIQEQRLKKLQERVHVPFDQTRPDHQEELISLWYASFPDIPLRGLISEQWKDMGWQGTNPSTDFRGCGFISLENLLYFARNYPDSFRRILFKEDGMRATWEYPFAVAGINVTFMLIQMLDLSSVKPRTRLGTNFFHLLEENEEAFDILFCVAFVMLDAQWLAMHASYMEFNDVLRATKTQLSRELCLEDVHQITDLPAYLLLYR